MAYLKLDLDNETFTRLMDVALQERRPIPWQAEVLLRRALGLPFPVYGEVLKGIDRPAITLVISPRALAYAKRKAGHRRDGIGGFLTELLAREEARERVREEAERDRESQRLPGRTEWERTGGCVD